MNPYNLLQDMKEVGFLSPLFFKSFSILGVSGLYNEWVLSLLTVTGSIHVRATDLGYVELCIPLLSLSSDDEDTIIYLSSIVVEFHSQCVGFASIEEDKGRTIFFYHLPIVNNYSKKDLVKLLDVVQEDCSIINQIFESIDKKPSIDLDLIGDQINSMEEDSNNNNNEDQD